MNDQDRELLEQACDAYPRNRLHVIVHPDPSRAEEAARHLAKLLEKEEAEAIRPRGGTWNKVDSRLASVRARTRGGPLILLQADDGTDPLLKELEEGGSRTIIITRRTPPPPTLRGRGNTINLHPERARRTRQAGPSSRALKELLSEGGLTGLSPVLRQTSSLAYGARTADALLKGRREQDLPPQLQASLAIARIRPTIWKSR